MVRDTAKRERVEDSSQDVITSITSSKKRILSKLADNKPKQDKQKSLTRRDTVHRRVSTSFDQSTLDLEDQVFSPPPKLDEKRRKSFHSKHSLGSDDDSSYSTLSIPQEYPFYYFYYLKFLLFDTSFSADRSVDQSKNSIDILCLEELKTTEELKIPEVPDIVKVDDSLLCDEEDDISDDLYSIIIIKTLPPYDSIDPSLLQHNLLPDLSASSKEYTIVLDLDETLVHCVMEPIEEYDHIFEIEFNGAILPVYACFRPYLQEFLDAVAEKYEIVVFTASQHCYADKVLDIIDTKKRIKHRLYREHCLCIEDNYIKDLNSLNRDIKKTVIVDNSVYAFGYQLDNGIPIKSWFNDKNDNELQLLIPFLSELLGVGDVRTILHSKYLLEDKIKEYPVDMNVL